MVSHPAYRTTIVYLKYFINRNRADRFSHLFIAILPVRISRFARTVIRAVYSFNINNILRYSGTAVPQPLPEPAKTKA